MFETLIVDIVASQVCVIVPDTLQAHDDQQMLGHMFHSTLVNEEP